MRFQSFATVKQITSGAFSGALDDSQIEYEQTGTATEDILIHKMILQITFNRSKRCEALILVAIGPHDTLNSMKAETVYSGDFLQVYGKFIWFKQMVTFGSGVASDPKQLNCFELSSPSPRQMTNGDDMLILIMARDQDTNAAVFVYSFQKYFDYTVRGTSPFTAFQSAN